MFIQEDIIEFINRIINQSTGKDDAGVKSNISKFRSYLKLTEMCDDATLADIDIIVDCLDELLSLKGKIGELDVRTIIPGREEKKEKPKKLEKTRQAQYDEKHYRHYSTESSSGCGSSSISRSSSCGSSSPSYSSSCGSSYTSYRSC